MQIAKTGENEDWKTPEAKTEETEALIAFLGRSLYGNEPATSPHGGSAEDRRAPRPPAPDERILALAEREGLQALFYWLLHDAFPKQAVRFQAHYQAKSAWALKQEHHRNRLFRLLEDARIPFLPIKGADLAWRVYPLPALRWSCDWDVLVRKKDMRAFCDLLERDGWICPVDSLSDHHLGLRRKKDLALEPHFLLPNLELADEDFVWTNSSPAEPDSSRRTLNPELNLIMLFQHDAINRYQTSNLVKLLLDVFFLLKRDPPDWEKVARLCIELKVPHPGLLLHAFPEFFPERLRPAIPPSGEVVSALRRILLTRHDFHERQNEIEMHESPLRRAWWKRRLQRLSDENLRWKYGLPANCGRRALLLCRLKDVAAKARFFVAHLFRAPEPELKRHLQDTDLIAESWRALRSGKKRG